MTTPFLTYELLTPETADPVVIRIREQLNIELYLHPIRLRPNYRKIKKALCGYWDGTGLVVEIPLSDWPAVKQAIRELNEHYKEKDMKEGPFEFFADEYNWKVSTGCGECKLTVTRKNPKVKVEWSNCSRFGDGLGENGIDFSRHGYCRYHIVQFRVTGWTGQETIVYFEGHDVRLRPDKPRTVWLDTFSSEPPEIRIGKDAKDKFSRPVLLPESIFSRLDEITKALEDRANGGKE